MEHMKCRTYVLPLLRCPLPPDGDDGDIHPAIHFPAGRSGPDTFSIKGGSYILLVSQALDLNYSLSSPFCLLPSLPLTSEEQSYMTRG
jgi:hypothetical protein